MTALRVYIEPVLGNGGEHRTGKHGELYRARLGSPDGPVLVEASCEPLLAGCRILLSRGVTGAGGNVGR